MAAIRDISVIISTTTLFAEVSFEYFSTVMLTKKCCYLLIPQRQPVNYLNNYIFNLDLYWANQSE